MSGFRASRHLTGGQTFRTKRYAAIVSGALRIGDPVRVSAGSVGILSGSAACIGVVARVYDANGKPKTGSLPAGTIAKESGVSGFVDVYDDPDIVFEVTVDATASAGMIGTYHTFSAGTPSTAAGLSGAKLIQAAASAAADGQFVVLGLAPRRDVDTAANLVEVRIQKHVFRDAS
jgi:hypothetical protein